jgi:hypothetical protein
MVDIGQTDLSDVSASSSLLPHQARPWSRNFTYQGRQLFYNRIAFNNSAERAVEVPLAFDFLAQHVGKGPILEVGNVLQHYENALSDSLGLRHRHIVDKFEVGSGIENIDIFDIQPSNKYQTIVCISTVEHVSQNCDPLGNFGEQQKSSDLEAPLKAIAKLYDLLEEGGRALITLPFGKLIDGGWYVQASSEYLDLLVTKYGLPADALAKTFFQCIARERKWINPRQIWIETAPKLLANVRYDDLRSGARAIVVLELTRTSQPFSLDLTLPPTPLDYTRSVLTQNMFFMLGQMQRLVRR